MPTESDAVALVKVVVVLAEWKTWQWMHEIAAQGRLLPRNIHELLLLHPLSASEYATSRLPLSVVSLLLIFRDPNSCPLRLASSTMRAVFRVVQEPFLQIKLWVHQGDEVEFEHLYHW